MEILSWQIEAAINNLAVPRFYDWLMFIICLAGTMSSIYAIHRTVQLTKKQTEIMENQNKVGLLEQRIKCFNILTGCMTLYKENKIHLVDIKQNPFNFVNMAFVFLTNNAYLQEVSPAIKAPPNDHRTSFLMKMEDLNLIATEFPFIFSSENAVYAETFILSYKDVLKKMYQFEVGSEIFRCKEGNEPLTEDNYQKKMTNLGAPQNLSNAIAELNESYQILIKHSTVEKLKAELSCTLPENKGD